MGMKQNAMKHPRTNIMNPMRTNDEFRFKKAKGRVASDAMVIPNVTKRRGPMV